MDISSIKKDASSIEAGQWVGDIPGMGELRLKVRGSNCKMVIMARQKKELAVPMADRERDGSLKFDDAMRVYSEIQHEVILLDWDGMTDNGKPVPYEADMAKTLLTNPDYIDFANAVVWASDVVDKGRSGSKEAMGKPVASSSGGKSSVEKT